MYKLTGAQNTPEGIDMMIVVGGFNSSNTSHLQVRRQLPTASLVCVCVCACDFVLVFVARKVVVRVWDCVHFKCSKLSQPPAGRVGGAMGWEGGPRHLLFQ